MDVPKGDNEGIGTEASVDKRNNADEEDPPLQQRPSSLAGNSSVREYPDAFYCPITKKVMQDPVVLDDGRSYERSAVQSSSNSSTLVYSNRALKAIIEESKWTALQKFQHTAKQFFVGASVFGRGELSNAFYCPISLNLIHLPVIDSQGYTYEKAAIESWVRVNGDSPVTRSPLSMDQLVPNTVIRDLLQAEVDRCKDEDILHPDLLRWKHEAPPQLVELVSRRRSRLTATAPNTESGDTLPLESSMNFPTTAEQLQRLQEEHERLRTRRMCGRFLFCLFLIITLLLGARYPTVAATALFVLLVWVGCSMRDSVGSTFG